VPAIKQLLQDTAAAVNTACSLGHDAAAAAAPAIVPAACTVENAAVLAQVGTVDAQCENAMQQTSSIPVEGGCMSPLDVDVQVDASHRAACAALQQPWPPPLSAVQMQPQSSKAQN